MSIEKSDEMVKGAIYLRQHVWDEIAALATANGIKEAEQTRTCLLLGLRSTQENFRKATGDTPGHKENG